MIEMNIEEIIQRKRQEKFVVSRVNSIADKGKLVDERYRIEAVDIVVKWDNDLADIWDQRRLKILKG